MNRQNEIDSLNNTFVRAVKNFKPPERLTVSQWAEKNRRLSPESSAEAGPWRNERTPYLVDIMDAFTDPKVNKLTVVAVSYTHLDVYKRQPIYQTQASTQTGASSHARAAAGSAGSQSLRVK